MGLRPVAVLVCAVLISACAPSVAGAAYGDRHVRDLGVGVAIGTPFSSSPSLARRSAIVTTIFGYRR